MHASRSHSYKSGHRRSSVLTQNPLHLRAVIPTGHGGDRREASDFPGRTAGYTGRRSDPTLEGEGVTISWRPFQDGDGQLGAGGDTPYSQHGYGVSEHAAEPRAERIGVTAAPDVARVPRTTLLDSRVEPNHDTATANRDGIQGNTRQSSGREWEATEQIARAIVGLADFRAALAGQPSQLLAERLVEALDGELAKLARFLAMRMSGDRVPADDLKTPLALVEWIVGALEPGDDMSAFPGVAPPDLSMIYESMSSR
jgi:hypothetical protein